MQKATTFTHKKHKEINRNECKKRQTQNKTEENARQRVSEVHSMTASLLGREHQGRSPTKQTINHISKLIFPQNMLFFIFIQFYSKHPVFRCKINLNLSGNITIFIEIRLPLVKNNSSNKGLKAFEVGIEKAHWARDLFVLYLRWVYLGSGWNFNGTWEL